MVNSALDTLEVQSRDGVNLRNVPLRALGQETRKTLSNMLNKRKVFRTDDGYFRDWRGLCQAICLGNQHASELKDHANPTTHILYLWQKGGAVARCEANLCELQRVLGLMGRYDVWDDTEDGIYEDARSFMAAESSNAIEKHVVNFEECDADIITKDDTSSYKQKYDAFILYADADIQFASEIIERMEDRGLKLCVKDRDILAGIEFEHDVFVRLISERCRQLIVVISEEFLKSPLNGYFVMYTQALQIEQKKRKIIPCVQERMQLPNNLRYYSTLDYKRANKLYNFWNKLEDAIKDKSANATRQSNQPSITITPNIVDVPNSKVDIVSEPLEKHLEESNAKSNGTLVIRESSCNSEKTSDCSTESPKTLFKKKWYTILGRATKVNQDKSEDKPEKKKKWYKSNKNIATAL